MTHQGNAAVHQHPPAVEYSRTRRSIPARGTPLPYNGWCSRYIAANEKAAGDPPGRCGCRSAAHAKQNAPHHPDRAAIKITDTEHGKPPPVNSSREDWTDDIRSVTVLQPQEFPNYF